MLQNDELPFEASSANDSKTAISETLCRRIIECSRNVYRMRVGLQPVPNSLVQEIVV